MAEMYVQPEQLHFVRNAAWKISVRRMGWKVKNNGRGTGYENKKAAFADMEKIFRCLSGYLFFLCLFFWVLNIFGSQYVMIVSLVTVLFQVNYKKRNTLKSLLGISALQLALSFLAYIATLSFPFSMI